MSKHNLSLTTATSVVDMPQSKYLKISFVIPAVLCAFYSSRGRHFRPLNLD